VATTNFVEREGNASENKEGKRGGREGGGEKSRRKSIEEENGKTKQTRKRRNVLPTHNTLPRER
jgi:hypothetical protein